MSTMGTFFISISIVDKNNRNVSFGYSYKMLLGKCWVIENNEYWYFVQSAK
jgi:hypothetical protein